MEKDRLSFWSNNKEIEGTICIEWFDEELGFGEIQILMLEGVLFIDSEKMGKEFVKKVLNRIIDKAELTG